MAEIPDRIKKIVEFYLKTLRSNDVPIERAILFGSYASGEYHEWSDIDLALVSNIFEGVRFFDKDKIRDYKLSVSSELEILPYRPEHFTSDDPFVKEILDTGIDVTHGFGALSEK